MNFGAAIFSENQLEMLFPPRIRGLLQNDNNYAFAAYEDDKIYAVAVAGTSADSSELLLHYFAPVNEGGYSTACELISFIEDYAKENDYSYLHGYMEGEIEDMMEAYECMDGLGYTLLRAKDHLVVYLLEQMEDSIFSERLGEMKKYTDMVKAYNELDKRQITNFSEKFKKKGLNFKLTDLVFGRFFMVKDEIAGYMDMSEIAEGVLLLKDVYLEKTENANLAFPAMIASSLLVSNALMPPETAVVMQLKGDGMYNGIIASFGTPEVDHIVNEYAKEL